MREVPLLGRKGAGRVTLVDDADYELVSQYKWYLLESPRNGRSHGPYAYARPYANGKQTTVYMHRLLTGYPITDHIDHDGLNNQRYNLREATRRQNAWNSRPRLYGGESRFKGVHRIGGGVWGAAIVVSGKRIFLGRFNLEEAAAWAYDVAAREHHGEFACPNFQSAGDPLGLRAPSIADGPPLRPQAPRRGQLVKLRNHGRIEHLRLLADGKLRGTYAGPEFTLYGHRTRADGIQSHPRPVIRYSPAMAVEIISPEPISESEIAS